METALAWFYAEHAAPWALVFCRVLGLFVFTPVLAGRTVPVVFRVMLAAMMATCVYGVLPPEHRAPATPGLAAVAVMVFSEALIGVSIGLIAGLPLLAVEMSGQLVGYQLGFAVAQASNPDLDINLDAIGMLLFIIALSVFLAMGGLDETIGVFLGTFGAVPAGSLAFADAPLGAYVGVLHAGTDLAVAIAAPVIGVVLTSLLAIAFIMRTVPQLNVMSVGFAVGILGGVFVLVFSLEGVGGAVRDATDAAVGAAGDWAAGIAARAGGR